MQRGKRKPFEKTLQVDMFKILGRIFLYNAVASAEVVGNVMIVSRFCYDSN